MSEWTKAIVIGASSGLGKALAAKLAARGCTVAAVARREELLQRLADEHRGKVLPFVHDVRRFEEVPALFQEITKQLGGLDLIIYASGVMPKVGFDEFDFKKDSEIFEVNVLGAVAWLDQAATRFHHAEHGTIVAIGSVAGDRGRMGQPAYNASKAALATYMEALRNRLTRRGVVVATMKPGPMHTPMTANLQLAKAMHVDEASEIILRKAQRPGEHYLKITHRIAFAIIRLIPSWIFRKLNL